MGTFYWKSRQRWAAQVTMTDGKRATATCHHDHSTRGRGPCPEAKELLADLERLRESHAPANARTLTLGKFLLGWLDDVKPSLAYSTWRKHESICRVHLIPELGHVRLPDLSVAHVRAYLSRAQGDPQSLRHHRGTLRRALADAMRSGYVSRNVAALAQPPKLPHRERPILNAEQARALIEGTRDDRYHALYVLAVTTGMRSAELLGLTWEDIDFGRDATHSDGHGGAASRVSGRSTTAPRDASALPAVHTRGRGSASGSADRDDGRGNGRLVDRGPSVTVDHTLVRVGKEWRLGATKTDKSRRVIPLTPVAVSALKAHRTRQMAEAPSGHQGLVFTTPTGKPVWGSNLLLLLRAHLVRLKLPKVGIHDLRHSAATMLYASGVALPTISDILGHSTVRVTQDLYRHRVEALSVDAAKKMQEAVGG